jgi:Uma2 family endonuclease
MLQYNPLDCLPDAEDLLNDDTSVDNQLQHLICALLEATLAMEWADRMDWFFGVDLRIYYHPKQPAIAPDAFLSLGVERIIDENLRLAYLLWEEQHVPIMALEVVYHQPGGEYTTKRKIYTQLEVLYYVIYSPLRDRKRTLEVYRLVNGKYRLQPENPVWLPEIGLGIGCEHRTYQGITREWLYWYNEQGKRLLTPEERVQILAERLRALGVDPDSLF